MEYGLILSYIFLLLCLAEYLKIALNCKMVSQTLIDGGYSDTVRYLTIIVIFAIGIPAVLYNTVVRICTLKIFTIKHWHKTEEEYKALEQELKENILALAKVVSSFVGG